MSEQNEFKGRIRPAAKKRKKEKAVETASVPEGWTLCRVYMKRKNRFCRQQPVPKCPQQYCGNHQYLLHGANLQSPQHQQSSGNEAVSTPKNTHIPCPVDNSHWILKESLQKHLLICPKAKELAWQSQQVWFCKDCNASGSGPISPTKGKSSTPLSLDQAKALALHVLQTHARIFETKNLSDHEIRALTLSDIELALPMEEFEYDESLFGSGGNQKDNNDDNHYRIRFGGLKHMRQQGSLLGHLRAATKNHRHESNPHLFVEVGAGRGMMGLVAAGVMAADFNDLTRLLLVERSGSRDKAEKTLRNFSKKKSSSQSFRFDKVEWQRVQCDLQDLDMGKAVASSFGASAARLSTHVIGKHVCGVGTDLSLKALENMNGVTIQSCIMATCCHGICFWKDYVGRDFLVSEISAGPAEFDCIRKWCAASVATKPDVVHEEKAKINTSEIGDSRDKDETYNEHIVGETASDGIVSVSQVVEALGLTCGKLGLGRACQRLIDYGRLQYMKNELKFSRVKLVHYVPSSVTPQNAVLVAER